MFPPSRSGTSLVWSTLSVWDLSINNQEALANEVCQTFIEVMSDESQTIHDEQIVSQWFFLTLFSSLSVYNVLDKILQDLGNKMLMFY